MTGRVSGDAGVTALVSVDHFVSHLYLLALPPLFPLLVGEFDADVTALAVSVSLVYLAQFLFQIPAGELVDRVGGKRVLVGGLLTTGLSVALIGAVGTYPAFLALAFLSGVGQAPFHPANYALLDAVGDGDEGKRFSVHSFGGFAGFAAAPAVVTGLAAVGDWRLALGAVGAGGVLYAGVLAVALAPVHRARLDATEAPSGGADGDRAFASVALLRRPLVAGMFAFFLVLTLANTGVQTYTTAFAVQDLGLPTAVGNAALTGFLAATAGCVLVGGWLADRYDPYLIVVGSLAWTAVVLGAGLTADLDRLSVVAVWATAGVGFGLTLPARDRITNALSGAADTGKSFGIVYTGLPIGGSLAPVAIGWVIDRSTAAAGVATVASCFLLSAGIALALLLYRRSSAGTGSRPVSTD